MRSRLLFILTLWGSCVCAYAQDSTKVTMLREVAISASRAEQPVIEVPRSVTIINETVIGRSIYQSLGDLLNSQSGLYVTGVNQTPGTNQNVFMRGASSNQVAVLVDGVRVTDPSSPNAAIDLSEISLANVERVEIIRGSHSTLFGGAAIGGVINLITKKNPRKGFHGLGSWQGGMFGQGARSSTENLSLHYGAGNGIYANASLFRQDVRGLDATEKVAGQSSFTADRDDFEKMDVSVKAGYKNDRWDASVSFKRSHQYTEIDNGAFSDDDNNYLVFDRDLFQYQLGYKIGAHLQLVALGSFSDSERFYENDSSRVNTDTYDKAYASGTYYGNLQTHEMHLNIKLNRVKGLVGAGMYREEMFFDNYFFFNDAVFPFESVTNYDSLNTLTRTDYIFSQWTYSLNRFNLSAGSRLSRHTTAGNFPTFELDPSYMFENFLVYASLSSGFNAPSLYQLYDPTRNFNAHTTRGNARLKPEKSLSFEIGVKKEFSRGSYLTFSAYQTAVRNAIEYVYLWDGNTAVPDLGYNDDRGDTYLNVGKQTSRGLELEGLLRIGERLSWQATASLVGTRMEIGPRDVDAADTGGHHVQFYNLGAFLLEGVEQEDLIRRPNFTGFSRFNFLLRSDLTIGAIYRYTGKRFDATYDGALGPYGALARVKVEAYHLVDVDVHWQATKSWGAGLKIENVLDENYRELAGFQTRGRSVFLKLTAKW